MSQHWQDLDGVPCGVDWPAVKHRVCSLCDTLLSFGPARDDGEHAAAVAIERRAAEMATWEPEHGRRTRPATTSGEDAGWALWPYQQPQTADEWAGFHAAQIRNHGGEIAELDWARAHLADHAVPGRSRP